MATFLSQEWLDEECELAKDQPERGGVSATMQYVVSGGPDGGVKYYRVLEHGRLVDAQLGEMTDADVTMSMSYDDSVAITKGELDASVAFMQGRMKVAGDMGALMALLPLTRSPEYQAFREKVRDHTDF